MFKYFALLAVSFGMAFWGCAPKEEISVKKVGPTKYVFISCLGNYSKIESVFGELDKWLADKEIEPAGAPFGIYYDDPNKVPPDECRYDICIPISAEIEGDSLVQIKEIAEMEVASIMHKGAYENVGPSWGKLYGWIFKNKYEPAGPGMEVYLNSPMEVPEDSLLTEIQVPVKKK